MAKVELKTAADAAAKTAEKLDFFEKDKDTMAGFEQINAGTMAVPFVRILQKLSPQLDKKKPEYIPGAEEGHWYNTASKKVYGNKISVLVLKFEQTCLEWRPNRGGFAGNHTMENAAILATPETRGIFGGWKTKDGNSLQETYVYMCLDVNAPAEGPFVISLSSSMIKGAREWNRLMVTHVMDNGERAKPYYLIWDLTTDYRENDKGSWYTPSARFAGYVTQPLYLAAREERVLLPSRRVEYALLEAPKEPEF